MLESALPRDILTASLRHCRGMPFTPLAAFEIIGGPRFNEFLPDLCRLGGIAGAADGVEPSSPSAEPDATQETNHG